MDDFTYLPLVVSKAHRQIIVAAAVKAGAHSSWAEKFGNNTLTDADVLGLAVRHINPVLYKLMI